MKERTGKVRKPVTVAYCYDDRGPARNGACLRDTQVPGLAVVIVGERKDSQTYVRMKHKACEEVGIHSVKAELPESVTQEDLLAKASASTVMQAEDDTGVC